LRTVIRVDPSCAATRATPDPGSAHASTIRARSASYADPSCDQRASSARSLSASTNGTAVCDMPAGYRLNRLISGATH